jgi:hypothetical protein
MNSERSSLLEAGLFSRAAWIHSGRPAVNRGAAMLRAVALLIFAVVSTGAGAAWVVVGKTESSTLYADPYMPQQGDLVTMWNMSDLNASKVFTPGGPTFSAIIRQEEFNCREERMRTVYLEFNTRNMGRGDAVHFKSWPSEWTPVGPAPAGSGPRPTDRLYFEIACRKPGR